MSHPHPQPGPESHADADTAPRSAAAASTPRSSFLVGAERAPDPLPATIDRYKIIRQLGRGGMGVVYLATRADGTISVPVALKVLKRGFDTDHILKRFRLERQLLGAMNHPNIARLFDAGSTEDGRPYLVMEYVEGEPLDKHCDSNKLDIPARLRVFQKVCAGVHALHQNLVVHRDLKPANVLVNPLGEPKLLDLGIAKLVNPVLGGFAEQTVGDQQMMTPEYASPEQVAGRPITTASDVYALGMILYELLAGERPYRFGSRTTEEIRHVVCDVDPEKPSTRVSRGFAVGTGGGTALLKTISHPRLARLLAGDLDDIVMMALEKVPSRRYPSAQDLSDDIERYLSNEPVRARRTSRRSLYKAVKFVHRNHKAVALSAASVLTLTVSAGVALVGWRNAAAAADAEARANQTAQTALQEAERQRDLARAEAQAKIGAVREGVVLATEQLTSAYEQISNAVDEPTERLQKLVEDGLAFVERSAALAPDAPGLEALRAEAFEKLGLLNYGPDRPHLGRPSDADRAFTQTVEMRERLRVNEPANPKHRLDLWQSYRFAAQSRRALGRPDAALELIEKSLDLAVADAAQDPTAQGKPELLARRNALRQAVSLATRAGLLRDLGRNLEAEAAARESARLRREFADDAARLSAGAVLGEHLLAVERYAQAAPILEEQLKSAPPDEYDARARRREASARFMLGDALANSGAPARGIEMMEAALAALAGGLPADAKAPAPSTRDQRRLASISAMSGRLGLAYLAGGRDAEALRAFGQQADLAARLLERDPDHVDARLLSARGLTGQARALSKLGRSDNAGAAATSAMREAQSARAAASASMDARRALAWACVAAAELHPESSQERAALMNDAVAALGPMVTSEELLPSDKDLLRRVAAGR